MRIWTRKPGFPVIKVEDQGDALALKQSRFFSSVVTKKQTSDNTVWPIPVKYSADGARPQYFMLAKKQDKLPLKGDREYLKFNKGEVGFYVTHYEPQLLEALQQPIRNKQLHQDDRMGVIRDSFSLAEAGEMSAAEALKIAQAYKGERSYNVWVEVLTGLAEVDVLLQGQPFKQRYHRFVLHLLGEIKKEIDWKPKVGESDNITLLRSLLLGALGQYGDRASLKQAVQLFRKTKKMDKIHPDVRAAVYYLTAQAGTRKDYARLRKLYEETDIHEEKNRLARALTLFRDPVLIKRTLKFLFSKDVRLQDGPFLMIYAWRNPAAWPHIWQFMQNNWDMLIKRYGQGGRMIGYMIKPLHHFSDPKTVLQVDRFLKTHKAPGAAMAVKQTLERIHSRADWRKRDLKNIEKFLSRYNY
jgi:aminopeptidase N